MLNYLEKPYKILLGTSVMMILLTMDSFFGTRNKAIDIMINSDTYYVIASHQIFFILIIFYLLLTLVYWLCRKMKLISILSIIHVSCSIFFGILLFYNFYIINNLGAPRRYYDFSTYASPNISELLSYTISITLFIQIILPINVLISSFRRNR